MIEKLRNAQQRCCLSAPINSPLFVIHSGWSELYEINVLKPKYMLIALSLRLNMLFVHLRLIELKSL